jgi:hypothetical protein
MGDYTLQRYSVTAIGIDFCSLSCLTKETGVEIDPAVLPYSTAVKANDKGPLANVPTVVQDNTGPVHDRTTSVQENMAAV